MAPARLTDPIDWVSDDPHLSGAFAPIGPEIEATDLTVLSGAIPPDLKGVYIRNGPNPRFQPVSYTYPLEGDGMLHAVAFDNGRARYRNRFVRTRSFEIEDRAGHAVYGPILRPHPLDPKDLGPGDDPNDLFKTSAFIGVLHHADHLLALGEVEPAWRISPDLDTLGPWTAGTDAPLAMGAHNRVHPVTGDLFALAYDLMAPVVHIHHIDPAGRLKRSFDVALAAPSMIHDFVLTEGHLVLLVGPAVFDMAAMLRGRPMLDWRPEIGTRIGVMALDGSDPHWIETDAFFVFHFANGFESGGTITVDYVEHEKLSLGYGGTAHRPPVLRRLVIDPAARSVKRQTLFDAPAEFPRIDDRRVARYSRFSYVPTLTHTAGLDHPASATFNCLVQVDGDTGAVRRHDFGRGLIGEAVFIPRGAGETEGLLATYVYNPDEATSDLVLLDAAAPDAAPVSVIRMPQRVPAGLHGIWVPG